MEISETKRTRVMISFEVKQKIKEVLEETGRILFPLNKDISNLIKAHTWRDRKYVGEHNGRVVVWQGYSINFVAVDFRYRALFIDVVDNVLPHQERVRLFGQD